MIHVGQRCGAGGKPRRDAAFVGECGRDLAIRETAGGEPHWEIGQMQPDRQK